MHKFKTKNGKKAKKIKITICEEDFDYIRDSSSSLNDIAMGLNHQQKCDLGSRIEDIAETLKSVIAFENILIEHLDESPDWLI